MSNTHSTIKRKFSLSEKLSSIFSVDKTKNKSKIIFKLENLEITDLDKYKISAKYKINDCQIYIATEKSGKMYYLIQEPNIDDVGKAIFSKIMRFLYISVPSETTNSKMLRVEMKKRIIEISKKLKIDSLVIPVIDSLLYYVIRDSFGYGLIDVLMKDPNLEDIVEESFAKPVGVVHRQFGDHGILDTNIEFATMETVNAFVQKLVQKTGKSMTAAVPYIDTMTKEGHRIAATFGKEISLPGPNFTIRKFTEKPFTITALLEKGTLSPLMAAYVWLLLDSKAFVLVIGSTAAGKTTTIGAFSSLLNPQAKITTIEDTSELRIGHTHWQRLITRKASSMFSDKYEVSMNELIKLSLRSRPDYIIVGEVRGEEISSLIQAVATGHGGLTSFHASDADATLVRMESPPMNVHLSGQMLISTILRQSRLVEPGGVVRRVTEITEVIPEKKSIHLKHVLGWDAAKSKFYPDDIADLINNSERLKEIGIINGWDRKEIENQLITRMCFLNKLLEKNKKDFDIVTNELEKFHFDPLEKYMSVLNTKSLV